MTGRNHIICENALMSTLIVNHIYCVNVITNDVSTFWGFPIDKSSIIFKLDSQFWSFIGINDFGIHNIIQMILFIVFATFGTLLPDCDIRESIIGKIIYIPIQHRTWTHSIWLPLIIAFIGFKCPCNVFGTNLTLIMIAISFGWLVHEFLDSFSRQGVAYLYPIIGYNQYGNAKIKQGVHFFKFYYTNKKSESIFKTIIISLCIIVNITILLSPFFKIIAIS